ncbi:ADP-ribosylation factor 4 [Pelomyxa schiedti]|nr:ADP-ribosylation factor 4 [Pelomyxa schiedti]
MDTTAVDIRALFGGVVVYLDARSLCRLSRTCQSLHLLVTSHPSVWRNLFLSRAWRPVVGLGKSHRAYEYNPGTMSLVEFKAAHTGAAMGSKKAESLYVYVPVESAVRKVLSYIPYWTPKPKILWTGFPDTGKKTTLYTMKIYRPGPAVMGTIGFNCDTLYHGNTTVTLYDTGPNERMRVLYRHYYQNINAFVWTVDSSNIELFNEQIPTFLAISAEPLLRNIPLLILANMQDRPTALSAYEICEAMRLAEVEIDHPLWLVQPCCARTGEGLSDAYSWLMKVIS